MLALEAVLVVRVPVTADGQNLGRCPVNRDHVRQRDAVLVLVPGHVVVNVHLINLVALVVGDGVALVLGLLLLNVRVNYGRLAKVFV